MRIAMFQMDVSWLDPDKNLQKIQNICSQISGKTDLLILPEMFSTGFVLNTNLLDPVWQHNVIKSITTLCIKYNLTIAGSIPFFNNGRWTNTMITVNGSGLIHEYDKVHLFAPAGENNEYVPGEKATVWSLENWVILPLICYDLRFPNLSFSEEHPHVLIYSANWPESRIHHWDALLKARAIENQCYVIGVNRVGTDENGYVYPGHSLVCDFKGDLLLSMDKYKNFDLIDLDFESMMEYRKKLPFQDDRKYCEIKV